jgi:tetratricopeptide (TPR) repeat protein
MIYLIPSCFPRSCLLTELHASRIARVTRDIARTMPADTHTLAFLPAEPQPQQQAAPALAYADDAPGALTMALTAAPSALVEVEAGQDAPQPIDDFVAPLLFAHQRPESGISQIPDPIEEPTPAASLSLADPSADTVEDVIALLLAPFPALAAEFADLLAQERDLHAEHAAGVCAQCRAAVDQYEQRQQLLRAAHRADTYGPRHASAPAARAWTWEDADAEGLDVLLLSLRRLRQATVIAPALGEPWLLSAELQLLAAQHLQPRTARESKSGGSAFRRHAGAARSHPRSTSTTVSGRRRGPEGAHVGASVFSERRTGPAAAGAELDPVEWLAKAITSATRAAELSRNLEPASRALCARVHGHIGRELFNAGHWAEAEAQLQRALSYAPKSPGLLFARAQIRFKRGVVLGCIDDLKDCLAKDPSHTQARTLFNEVSRMTKSNKLVR